MLISRFYFEGNRVAAGRTLHIHFIHFLFVCTQHMEQEKSIRCEGVAIVCHLAKNRITQHCIRRRPSKAKCFTFSFQHLLASFNFSGQILQLLNFHRSICRKYRDEAGSLVTVSMLDLPKQRYVRRNVKTILDYISTYFPLNISTLSMHSGSCPFGVIAIGNSESVPVCRYFMKKVKI